MLKIVPRLPALVLGVNAESWPVAILPKLERGLIEFGLSYIYLSETRSAVAESTKPPAFGWSVSLRESDNYRTISR